MFGAMYRRDYQGEFVVYDTVLTDGKYEEQREWIPNTIVNDSHNKVAVVIGNGLSRYRQNLAFLAAHKRQVPALRLQTYGCNALVRDFLPDFLVVTSECLIPEVVKYANPNLTSVLTTSQNILKYPGRYHLIPNNLNWNAGATATFLACFDGHKKVFLLGFDNQVPGRNNNIYSGTPCYGAIGDEVSSSKWEQNMYNVFRSYPDVEFIRVKPVGTTPESWASCLNFRQITQRQFVLEADL